MASSVYAYILGPLIYEGKMRRVLYMSHFLKYHLCDPAQNGNYQFLFFLSFLQIFSENRVILSLFSFVRANDSSSAVEWSPAQFEELQLQVNISLHLDITINFCKYCVLKRLKNSFEIVRFCIVTHLFFTIYKKKHSERTRTVLIVARLNSHLQRNKT